MFFNIVCISWTIKVFVYKVGVHVQAHAGVTVSEAAEGYLLRRKACAWILLSLYSI